MLVLWSIDGQFWSGEVIRPLRMRAGDIGIYTRKYVYVYKHSDLVDILAIICFRR